MIEYRQPNPQMKAYTSKSEGSLVLRSGALINDQELKLVKQPDHARVLKYTSRGRLSTIEFINGIVDLRELPQDETIPSEGKLIAIFSAQGVEAETLIY